MSKPSDTYYERKEVSNSDLTALKYRLYPQLCFTTEAQKRKAFHLGTLVDAVITEPSKVNWYRLEVDGEQYTKEEFDWAEKMRMSLLRESRNDDFLSFVVSNSDTQRFMTNERQHFDYACFGFDLPTRCKWDWWVGTFGGDLKTTVATTQQQFEKCIDFFDWDRSRAWYMDIARTIDPTWGERDFIYAISKKNQRVFRKVITRDSEIYKRGREKYLDLAFRYWTLCV
jgi:hypothetical protein